MLKIVLIPSIIGALSFIVFTTIGLWSSGIEKSQQKAQMQLKLEELENQTSAAKSESQRALPAQAPPTQVWVIDEIPHNDTE